MTTKYTQIPADTFSKLQINAGMVVDSFTLATKTIGNQLFATTGGISFSDVPTFTDWGDGIDNCPSNMMELKRIDSHEVKLSGTAKSIDAASAAILIGASKTATDGSYNKITALNDIPEAAFKDIWWIGDYGNGKGVAVKILNALNTAGFTLKTNDKGSGEFPFEFTGHYSLESQDTVPYEFYMEVTA